jgi:uncharacterized membrane protein YidH (DUF202 family)
VSCLSAVETALAFDGTEIMVAELEADLLDIVEESRAGRSFWFHLLLVGLGLLVLESLLAKWMSKRSAAAKKQTTPSVVNPERV